MAEQHFSEKSPLLLDIFLHIHYTINIYGFKEGSVAK